jgi:hypothetical protein
MTDISNSKIPPEDLVRGFRKCMVGRDIAGMAHAIGELHRLWEERDGPLQEETRTLDAIFLSFLRAYSQAKS